MTSCEHAHFGTVKWCIGSLPTCFFLLFVLYNCPNVKYILYESEPYLRMVLMMLIEGSSMASFPGLLTDWMEPSDGKPNLVTAATMTVQLDHL